MCLVWTESRVRQDAQENIGSREKQSEEEHRQIQGKQSKHTACGIINHQRGGDATPPSLSPNKTLRVSVHFGDASR